MDTIENYKLEGYETLIELGKIMEGYSEVGKEALRLANFPSDLVEWLRVYFDSLKTEGVSHVVLQVDNTFIGFLKNKIDSKEFKYSFTYPKKDSFRYTVNSYHVDGVVNKLKAKYYMMDILATMDFLAYTDHENSANIYIDLSKDPSKRYLSVGRYRVLPRLELTNPELYAMTVRNNELNKLTRNQQELIENTSRLISYYDQYTHLVDDLRRRVKNLEGKK